MNKRPSSVKRSRAVPGYRRFGTAALDRGFGFLCRSLSTQRRVGMGTTAPAAFHAISRDGGAGAFGRPAANRGLDDLRETGDAPVFISRKTLRTDLDAIDEGPVLVEALERFGSGRCPRFVKAHIVVLGQHALLFSARHLRPIRQ
jgi:hypothetical protein